MLNKVTKSFPKRRLRQSNTLILTVESIGHNNRRQNDGADKPTDQPYRSAQNEREGVKLLRSEY